MHRFLFLSFLFYVVDQTACKANYDLEVLEGQVDWFNTDYIKSSDLDIQMTNKGNVINYKSESLKAITSGAKILIQGYEKAPVSGEYTPNYVNLVYDICSELKKDNVKKMCKKYSNIKPECPIAPTKVDVKNLLIDPDALPDNSPSSHMLIRANITTGDNVNILSFSAKLNFIPK